ncbi:MAG: hypothetical protein M3N54_07485 [Acidobacteriota bacterium]|nr:hypothetical protein [Acidobacteriota bacterium]
MSPAETNRQNAQLSTGPTSEAGKSRVRLNGLRHGLTGNTVLMPYEDAAAYDAFVAATVEMLHPEGAAELELAHTIANGRWRINRALAVEENIFALGAVQNVTPLHPDPSINAALVQAQTFLQNAHQIQLLTLYEGRIDRAIRKSAAELKELQAARLAAQQQERAAAALRPQPRETPMALDFQPLFPAPESTPTALHATCPVHAPPAFTAS